MFDDRHMFGRDSERAVFLLVLMACCTVGGRWWWMGATELVRVYDLPERSVQFKVQVNSAEAEEFELLPGIGPKLAARIIEYREARGPFRAVEDLDTIKGIGPKTIDKLRPYLIVDGDF